MACCQRKDDQTAVFYELSQSIPRCSLGSRSGPSWPAVRKTTRSTDLYELSKSLPLMLSRQSSRTFISCCQERRLEALISMSSLIVLTLMLSKQSSRTFMAGCQERRPEALNSSLSPYLDALQAVVPDLHGLLPGKMQEALFPSVLVLTLMLSKQSSRTFMACCLVSSVSPNLARKGARKSSSRSTSLRSRSRLAFSWASRPA
jgi:hypothetical protein